MSDSKKDLSWGEALLFSVVIMIGTLIITLTAVGPQSTQCLRWDSSTGKCIESAKVSEIIEQARQERN